MNKTTLTRKLPALLLATAVGQLTFASAASAQGGLLGTGLFAPPPAPAPQVAAAPAAPTPLQVEQKLESLKYDVGPVDGNIDEAAGHAIMAFQKVNGLARTGKLDDAVTARIMATNDPPAVMVPNGEPSRVEVSLARQVLFLYQDGSLHKILNVSSGTSETPTPTGTFRMFRSESGWHTSRYGRLYNAQYFVGGYAIHGSLSVPAEPASHGCVRIPMHSAEWFPNTVPKGTQVVVLEG
ncbi:MAG TPA: L,D-transpeptidase family protein [Acidimicrobiales bacterium]|jgi:lipoprotein-anchoring transpeptidase ErfK/SrfK|nr:L,D-transpeptidase family protein [Acidimicrobiales bacterium]